MTSPTTSEPAVRDRALLDVLCYVALTILVWGVSAFRRGLWQDDVQALGLAFARADSHWTRMFRPDSSALRRLTVLPSALANATPYPVEALQILSAAAWLAMGLLAGWIVSLLLPNRRLTCFLVVCLTLTASSDYLTASMVPLAYNVAAICLLASIGCALIWLARGNLIALIASALLLASSLWNMDVALPAIPFVALLFVWVSGWRLTKRLAALLAPWTVVLIPVAIVEWIFLHDRAGYATVAITPMSPRAFAIRTIRLWLENFEPWRWAFARPQWYPRPPAAISTMWMAIGSLLTAIVFLFVLRKKKDAEGSGRAFGLTVFFASMALAANAAYAPIHLSEFHYRTHILSRVWTSAAIGILAAWAMAYRRLSLRIAGWVIATAFVFLGTWGGMERQDLFLATWRQHQRELSSILIAAPSLRPGTTVILRSEPTPHRYLATEADYLSESWLMLLYDQPELHSIRVTPERGTGCRATAAGLECWREGKAACVACTPDLFPYETLVLMDYDYGSNSYHLVPSLQGDPFARGHEVEAMRYRPETVIIRRPLTTRQRRILLVR
jgi:hypothetical protein